MQPAAPVTIEELEGRPYARLAELRASEPVAWIDALDGWLVTRADLALAVTRDARAFTVEDPRFTTARVVGPSMLSLDGAEHARHRAPFAAPFRLGDVRRRLAADVAGETDRLVAALAPAGRGELRRGFAGPLAAAVVTRALGLGAAAVDDVLGWYDAIVGAVNDLSAGRPAPASAEVAMAALSEAIAPVLRGEAGETLLGAVAAGDAGLSAEEIASNAAVVLFGGIETMEGMIANAVIHLLDTPAALAWVREDPAGRWPDAVEESLRLEPSAAAIDRYATADAVVGGAQIAAGDLVRVSITAGNRDPALFDRPDAFDPSRPNARRHLAFASGPHVCVGMHLARLEAHAALEALFSRLPRLRLAGGEPRPEIRGLIFRKPPALWVEWDPVSG